MNTLLKLLASTRFMIILLSLYAVVMAAATFVESKYGTPTAKDYFYNSWWFILLNFMMIVNFVTMSVRLRLWQNKKWGLLLLHYGFVVVLAGAMTTFVVGEEGVVHIREGESTNTLLNGKGEPIGKLPFSITLNDFVLDRYSGSGSPSSFESFLTINGKEYHAYMNNVVYYGQYRLYQSSYDKDLMGSVLSVNKDLLGTIISYVGYLLLMLGFVVAFFQRGSRFRTLLKSLSVVAVMALTTFGVNAQEAQQQMPPHPMPATAQQQPKQIDRAFEQKQAINYANLYALPPMVAEKFGRLRVQTPQGRIEPVDTYARELLRKISRSTSFDNLSADQALFGFLTQSQIWARVPMIRVDNQELMKLIVGTEGNQGKEIAFMDVLDQQGNYKLEELVQQTYSKAPDQRNKFDKELLKLDEKINILNALFQGQMFAIYPVVNDPKGDWHSPSDPELPEILSGADSMVMHLMPLLVAQANNAANSGNWEQPEKIIEIINLYQEKKAAGNAYSPSKISAELLYNKLEIFKWAGFGFMTLGLVLIIVVIVSLVTEKRLRGLMIALTVLTIGLFLAQNFAMGLRWYISERAPWTNSYESMIYIGWATLLGGLLFMRKSKITFALATFLAGVILFVTNLSWMDPQITPLVPVLKSYWLVVHVAVITASYGFFGIGFLLGTTTLLLMAINPTKLKRQIHELSTINELALWLGLALMTAGTFLGAIWANESWGRYWGWDPKETWALITMIVYAVVLHARLMPWLRGDYKFAVMTVLALGSVLMTFFGVNYYLTGMHSYGGDSAPPALNSIWIVYGAVAIIAALAYRKWRKNNI